MIRGSSVRQADRSLVCALAISLLVFNRRREASSVVKVEIPSAETLLEEPDTRFPRLSASLAARCVFANGLPISLGGRSGAGLGRKSSEMRKVNG